MAAPADEELEGLSRVLTRLALTEDDKLEQARGGVKAELSPFFSSAVTYLQLSSTTWQLGSTSEDTETIACCLCTRVTNLCWLASQVLSRLLPIVIAKLGPGASPAAQKKVS